VEPLIVSSLQLLVAICGIVVQYLATTVQNKHRQKVNQALINLIKLQCETLNAVTKAQHLEQEAKLAQLTLQ